MKVPQPHKQSLWAGGENKQDELFRKGKRTTSLFYRWVNRRILKVLLVMNPGVCIFSFPGGGSLSIYFFLPSWDGI